MVVPHATVRSGFSASSQKMPPGNRPLALRRSTRCSASSVLPTPASPSMLAATRTLAPGASIASSRGSSVSRPKSSRAASSRTPSSHPSAARAASSGERAVMVA